MLFEARPTSSSAIICPAPYPVLRRWIFFRACISSSLGWSVFCLEGSYFKWLFACNCKARYSSHFFFKYQLPFPLGLVGAAANGQGQEAAFSHRRWRSLAIFRRVL